MELLKKTDALIEFYEMTVEKNKNDMFEIFIIFAMSNHENFKQLDFEKKYKIMKIIYNFYMKNECKMDICYISDVVMENYQEILKYKSSFIINNYIRDVI